MASLEVDVPKKLLFLFEPHRHKVAYGGRGSGKSWTIAKALLILGYSKPLRILSAREVQKSIKESVKMLLDDQIKAMGMEDHYESLETEIRSRNGGLITFAGLQQHTIASIKSYEGYDVVWIEEAQTVSKKSFDVLMPTIRKPGSEIWVSFNPELDSDPVWKLFIENPPPDTVSVSVNWSDNRWFPPDLEQLRVHCKETAPEDYDTIWEGKCRAAVSGAIYAKELQSLVTEGRICNVPYDPKLKVHAIYDLGWNDAMTITLVQRGISDLRVIGYLEDSHKTLDWYASELNKLPYNWGYDWLPHDGFHGDFKTGKSAAEILKRFNRRVKQVPNIGVENGIKAARLALKAAYFDKTKCARLLECLKRYRRHINAQTNEPGEPVHDQYSHGADSWRYAGVIVDMLTNEDEMDIPDEDRVTFRAFDPVAGY